ncbi:MAG: hypothetical protein S0880_37585 [Actinomycetota bacterium]|nr:hypothetical protein [Actinomycetota bacterium]
MGSSPVRVVAALPLKDETRAHLADRLGPGHEVVDIRDAGTEADIVLTPSASPRTIAKLKATFGDAHVIVVELEDWQHGIDLGGPVTRALEAGADAYYVAESLDSLAKVLGALTSADSDGEGEILAGATRSLPAQTVDDLILAHLDEAIARRR